MAPGVRRTKRLRDVASSSNCMSNDVPLEEGNATHAAQLSNQLIGFENGPSGNPTRTTNPIITPIENNPATNLKRGRGTTRCLNLDERVLQEGKKISIVFAQGEKMPHENDGDFACAVGFIVKTNAKLAGIRYWYEIPDSEKEKLFFGLNKWFEIQDWPTSRVKACVYGIFQTQYRRWRSTLKQGYDEMKKNGIDPRSRSPRAEVRLETWLRVCDTIEGEEFQKQSKANMKNRANIPYPHTGGSQTFLRHFKKMGRILKL